jgi:hypothetical protein
MGPCMERIEDRVFRNETVRLDEKLFVNCAFERCALLFGGQPCEWENTRFVNCRLVLDGAANNTIQVLRGLGYRVLQPDRTESMQ